MFFFQFSVVELKFVIKIFTSRNPSDWNNNAVAKGKVGGRFYLTFLLMVALLYHTFSLIKCVLLILLSFVLPQLLSNAWFDTPHHVMKVHQKYYIVALCTRLCLPLYVWWSFGALSLLPLFPLSRMPSLALSYDFMYGGVLCLWCGGQLVLLASTVDRKNARWWVPSRFLPEIFDYRRDVPAEMIADVEQGAEAPTCAICMMQVDTTDVGEENEGSLTSRENDRERWQERRRNKRHYMLTPCNHLYHDACLMQWFESGSLTCPVCRASCPPECEIR